MCRQDSSGTVMNPTPGKMGWPGLLSKATNTPNRSIAETVPDMIWPWRSDSRNAQSSGLSDCQSMAATLPHGLTREPPVSVRQTGSRGLWRPAHA